MVRSFGEVGLQQILPGNVITWFQVLVLWLHVKEIFFLGLGVTVTEVNIKKLQKQDLKNIKNVKGCRDGMPKSMQTRWDDIIVKVNLQSPIPTSFYITVKLM